MVSRRALDAKIPRSNRGSRTIQTSIGGPELIVCGVPPEPTDEQVRLRQNLHPGFGYVELMRNGKRVWDSIDGRGCTLQSIERKITENDPARFVVEVHGPMVFYRLLRSGPKNWILTFSGEGFA